MLGKKQSGSALLAFMLLFVTSASYVLVKELNQGIRRANSGADTARALTEAKNALIGWSISHPVYPGVLPMPDRNGDSEYTGDSDCYTAGPIGNNLLLGKIPWKDVGSGCIDGADLAGLQIHPGLSDNASTATINELWADAPGKVFWYAASHNLVYETPAYPQISLALLETTTNWITVRDEHGCVISDRVAFVVVAPGPPLLSQDRSSTAPAASNYLDSITTSGAFTCPDSTIIADATTFSNSDTDQDFINYTGFRISTDNSDSFNGQLVYVTIDELMEGVEKRALNEAANILSSYHNGHQDKLPWLTTFTDPKANEKRLTGEHSGSDNQDNLTDSSANFTQWGVAAGDVVWNITDGSYGIVTAASATSLTIGAGLTLGFENKFDTDDEYYVDVSAAATAFTGTATAATSNLDLVDTSKDFEALGVKIGDILENLTDDSSGVIETVSATQLSVSSLSGGTNNVFSSTNVYQIRTSIGRATTDSDANGLTLDDTSIDFSVIGVQVGDLVRNISDGSYGRVTVVSANRLTVAELRFGTNNTFSNNDYYVLPRFNGSTNTRQGLFSFHEPGEVFHTGFSVDWGAQANDGSSVASTEPATDAKSQYANSSNGIKEWVERSRSNNSGTITVDESNGQCTWINSEIADCSGTFIDTAFLSGTVTSESGTYFYDTSQDFDDAGVYEGDKVENLTNGTKALVDSASSTGIHFARITGETSFSISTGDQYRVSIASKRTQHTADGTTDIANYRVYDSALSSDMSAAFFVAGTANAGSAGLVLVDTDVDFFALGMEVGKLVYNNADAAYGIIDSVDSATQLTVTSFIGTISFADGDTYQLVAASSSKIRIGDTVVENNSDGLGLITNFGFNYDVSGRYWFEYTPLQGGSEDHVDPGDSYKLLYDFVDRREYEFAVRINSNSSTGSGGSAEYVTSNIGKRDICMGYNSDCASSSGSDTTIPGDSITPMVTIKDYDNFGSLVGDATTTVPSAGASGRVKITGINILQSEQNGDIPAWFVDNDWHQYIYIAYSAGEEPGAVAVCTENIDCLDINVGSNTGASAKDDIRALVMLTGAELSGQSWTGGAINNYFEVTENTDGDDLFHKKTSDTVKGAADAGSTSLQLVDTDKNFTELGVSPGYIVVNTSDGSNGIVSTVVSSTVLTVNSLSGGTENDFDSGEDYEILSNDKIRVAVSCPSPNASDLCWSN